MLVRLAPALFVFLWSTGFVASKLGAPYAEPFTFLSIRFLLVIAIMVAICLATRAVWPTGAALRHAVVVGMLIHGVYLSGVFWAIRNGLPAGVTALIVSLQPVLTAILAWPLLGERIAPRHWAGLAIGLVGALLVVAPRLEGVVASGGEGITLANALSAVVALVGMTLGTIYQKHSAAHSDLRTGSVLQFVGALAVAGPLALAFETRVVAWTPAFVTALAWLVLPMSILSINLLMMLIRRNAVAPLSALFYLVPAVTAVIAFIVFGETLSLVQVVGVALVMAAVGLIRPTASG
jgi:drug/metabolite transporter (DMT)-like permease